jgi:thymidylate synthase (FAD)
MGDDLLVVNAARVSFGKQKSAFDPGDAKLIGYLAKNNHWTPFGHPQITMRETVPIFVARQRFKHMVGFVYNEVSRRYVDSDPEFSDMEWRGRAENKKQGSADKLPDQYQLNTIYSYAITEAGECYQNLLDAGVCPEQARAVLPQAMLTSYYVTGSLAAWHRAYKLRTDSHAQVEIQELAKQWGDVIEPLFPVSWQALNEIRGT